MSILDGIGGLVDEWLQIRSKGKPPCYRHRSAALELSRRSTSVTGTLDFLETGYTQVHENWLAAIEAGYSNPSKENWRWKRHPELSLKNTSPEIKLERSIIRACGDNWSNQMPTASGLVGPATDKRAAVDLVYRKDPTTYSFIELKTHSDNPLFAAVEILMHGLLFVWSKNNQASLGYDLPGQPVLAAKTLSLAVLAPNDYYQGFNLTNLVVAIDEGLAEFGAKNDLALGFQFREFNLDSASDPDFCQRLVAAMG